jgi:hypothetical protein
MMRFIVSGGQLPLIYPVLVYWLHKKLLPSKKAFDSSRPDFTKGKNEY